MASNNNNNVTDETSTTIHVEPPASVATPPSLPAATAASAEGVPEKQEEGEEDVEKAENEKAAVEKWPGWPGYNVFRLIVAVSKVGSIIGRKGELVKKMCNETRARIRILEGPLGTPDRIVLISGKEEPDVPLSPAMDAAVRVFKRVVGLSTNEGEVAVAAFCSIRLLVASSQAINLIGKQGSTIKSIQEATDASVRVLSEDEVPSYATSDERIVEIHGQALKVLKALEAVLGQLRKFLVDQSVVPIFEKSERPFDARTDKTQSSLHSASAYRTGIGSDYSLSLKRDPLYDCETHLEPKIPPSGLSPYGLDHGIGTIRSSGVTRTAAHIVTQMTQTMQVPLSYAEDIIGVGGSNIAYIRRASGAILTIQESGGLPDEITVEIKGTTSQVLMAQQLIQEFTSSHNEPAPSIYSKVDTGLSAYSRLPETTYTSSFASHIEGYGSSSSSGLGGYNSFRY
ncbi:RNA-binding KH domain-containing protein PEPPER-like isoform X2 [Durio zibethinus]|uniref:RNA-binding KH domain-containing protein PEPPER-like isoform X2 n=1 Tax=Durio zibethinus TaxID=66656 RepID=A0A6P5XM09_DURZI|nr:RNA-binding KH domain-containing protein PEPPER-like isoform X2 [Durio zibethinus]